MFDLPPSGFALYLFRLRCAAPQKDTAAIPHAEGVFIMELVLLFYERKQMLQDYSLALVILGLELIQTNPNIASQYL